ncbi:DUF2007 domain-containing protein [Roseivirga sp. BDSF3-8]|uniref:putative signal transducing protein n=1 Tax=Roseivirga sp. BDSF3-8 TaxID=3241598 RepID=UPI003531C222
MGRLVTIHTCEAYPEAFMLRSRLEANGIPCFVADEHMHTLYGMVGNFIGGIRLQVRGEDVMLAKTLLNELPAWEEDPGDAEPVLHSITSGKANAEVAEILCPACASDNCRRENGLGLPESFSVFLQGFPFLRPRYRYRCFGCSHQWEDKP